MKSCFAVSGERVCMWLVAVLLWTCSPVWERGALAEGEGEGGDSETAQNPDVCTDPNPDGSCKCETSSTGSSQTENGCVMVKIGLGDPHPASSGVEPYLRLFANDPAPDLYTPAGLRLVMGFAVMHTTGGKTAGGVPRSVVVARASGMAVTFTFADGESIATASDGFGGSFPYRLVMTDARGWSTVSDPAYYDLYPGDGTSYRFVAAAGTPDYLQFVRHVSASGQVSGLRELGLEAVRDAEGGLLQVRTPARLADIRVLGPTSYAVRLYPNTVSAVSETLGADGRYAVLDEGALIEALTFSDPGNGTLVALNVDRTAGGVSARDVFSYTRATRDWTLTKSGGKIQDKRTSYVKPGDTSRYLRDVTTRTEGGAVSSRSVHEYKRYSWGIRPLKETSGDPDSPSSPWKAYEYYEDAPLAGYLKKQTASDGSWTSYAYDAQGRVTSESKPFADGAAVSETLSFYTPLDPGEAGIPAFSDSRPRTVIERIGGVEVARTYHAYPTNSLGGWAEIEERAAFPGAPYGHASNRRTVRTWFSPSAEALVAGRPASVVYPGGQTETYGYAWGTFSETAGTFAADPDGDAWARTVTTSWPGGQTASESVTEVWNRRAMKVLEFKTVTLPGGESGVIASSRNYYDGAGHVIRTERSDGRVETASWGSNCCGKESETSSEGVITVYGYNALKQKVSETKKGFAADGADDLTTLYTYDLNNRVLSVAVTNHASGLGYVASRSAYDLGGRLTNAWDRLGNPAATEYDTNGTVTARRPNGVVRVTEKYEDGRARLVSEDNVVRQAHAYGVTPEGQRWTLSAEGALPSVEAVKAVAELRSLASALDCPWSLEFRDSFGQPVLSMRPGFGRTVLVASNAYDKAGNVLSSVETSCRSDGTGMELFKSQLYAYADDGSRLFSALDLNTNGVIDVVGPDRIDGSAAAYEKAGADWWQVSRRWVYPEFNSSVVVTTSVRRIRLTGLGVQRGGDGVLVSQAEALDIRGNATVSETLVDRAERKVTRVNVLPTSVQPEIRIAGNGLLLKTVSSTAVTNTFGYDVLGRQASSTDGRGNTTVTVYNPLGLVNYIENAASNRTTYGYDFLGRRSEVTDALGNITHTHYDPKGRIIATWGATYPVAYGYDTQGRMTEMGTYRGTTEITGYAGFQSLFSSFDKTRWLYDNPTGLLTNKLYADGHGPVYTYTADGKPESLLRARGVRTTYAYDAVGSLVGLG